MWLVFLLLMISIHFLLCIFNVWTMRCSFLVLFIWYPVCFLYLCGCVLFLVWRCFLLWFYWRSGLWHWLGIPVPYLWLVFKDIVFSWCPIFSFLCFKVFLLLLLLLLICFKSSALSLSPGTLSSFYLQGFPCSVPVGLLTFSISSLFQLEFLRLLSLYWIQISSPKLSLSFCLALYLYLFDYYSDVYC